MSDMTREEAIKNLKELLKWYLEEEMLSETVYKREAVDTAISALSENKGEWIPVTERLPEKNVWVLVTVEQSGKCYQEIMQIDRYKETWTDNIDYYAEAVKAWMPLPEPYKRER